MKLEAVSKIAQALGSEVWDADEKVNSAGTWSMISCPLAPWEAAHNFGRDSHPSFSVNVEPGASICKCFSCDFTGPLATVVRKVKSFGGIDEETEEQLLNYIAYEKEVGFTTKENTYVPLLPSFLTDYLLTPHSYMAKRGLSEEDMYEWSLGYSDDLERVLIPFYNNHGTLIAIIGRDVTEEADVKYMIYPSGFPRGQMIFGLNKLSGKEEAILVVEGYLDAITANKYLPENIGVVAVGSAIPTKQQMRQIISLAPEIIIGLDNPKKDKAGEKGYNVMKSYMSGRCILSEVDYRQFKDAGEAGEKIGLIVEHRNKDTLLGPLMARLQELDSLLTSSTK